MVFTMFCTQVQSVLHVFRTKSSIRTNQDCIYNTKINLNWTIILVH